MSGAVRAGIPAHRRRPTPGPVGGSLRDLAKRVPALKAMGLSPIGDIANPTLTDNTPTGDLTWETATDWDNAVSEVGVAHEAYGDFSDGSILRKGYSSSDEGGTSLLHFNSMHESSSPLGDHSGNGNDVTMDGGTFDETGPIGGTSVRFDGSDDDGDYGSALWNDVAPFCIFMVIKFNSISGNSPAHGVDGDHIYVQAGVNGDDNMALIAGSNDEINVYVDDGGENDYTSTSSPLSTGSWLSLAFRHDGSTIYGYVDATEEVSGGAGTPLSGEGNNTRIGIGDSGFGEFLDAWTAFIRGYNRDVTASEIQNLHDAVFGESSLTTATKSFGSNQQPDLSNLDYTRDGSQIIIDVIGSPGTGSEETVSQTLDGATSYTLTWSNSHTDFRVKPRLDNSAGGSPSPENAPTVNSITLTA